MSSLDLALGSADSAVELGDIGSNIGSGAFMAVDSTGNPTQPPGPYYVVIDEAVTEVDEADGAIYTAYGFLVQWRGHQ